MGRDLIDATLRAVDNMFAPMSAFFNKYTTQQPYGTPMDLCDKLRGILASLEATGVQLLDNLRSLEIKQVKASQPIQATPAPSVFMGVSNLGFLFFASFGG